MKIKRLPYFVVNLFLKHNDMFNLNNKTIYFFGLFILMTFNIFSQTIISAEINKMANEYVADKHNKGLVIGIVNGGEMEIKGYGILSDNKKVKPDENTIFEVGGITNVFTTSLMLLESYAWKFSIGDRVQDYAPAGVIIPNYQHLVCTEYSLPPDFDGYDFDNRVVSCQPDPSAPAICISFCDLASHTSGLPSEPKVLFRKLIHKKNPYKNYTKEKLYNDLPKYTPVNAPGICFNYSNIGMALLGNIMADANGSSYEGLLKMDIIWPLKMEHTGVELNRTQLKYLAQGHSKKGRKTNHWQLSGMAPAGGLKSSASDMVKFLQANLLLNTEQQLIVDALGQTHEPHLENFGSVLGRKTSIGYGWFISELTPKNNTAVVWHTGATGGFRAYIGFIKATNTGVVILSNSANGVDEMGFEILGILNSEYNKRIPSSLGENK